MVWIPERDESGRPIYRSSITDAGWAYLALGVTLDAFNLTSTVKCKDRLGTDYSTTAKWYDAEYGGSEITSPTQTDLDNSAKRCEIDLDIGFDFDIVQGQLFAQSYATGDFVFDVSVGPNQLGEGYLKSFVEGLNLNCVKDIETNGRAPKKLLKTVAGVPGSANVMRMYIRRPSTSTNHKFQTIFELYRA